MIRVKAKWLKYAEKNTKYFFNLEKRNYINKTIQQLINDKGRFREQRYNTLPL
jgi:hypothetical protein